MSKKIYGNDRAGSIAFASFAVAYAKRTGCDRAKAQQASFALATALADFLKVNDAGDYFSKRALEMDDVMTGETWQPVKFELPTDCEVDDPSQVSAIKPANETNLSEAYYRNSYWI
jgi:hypothetical protein